MAILNDVERAQLEDEVQTLCERGDLEGAATAALRGFGGEILGFLIAVHRNDAIADDVFSAFAEGLWRGLPRFNWSSTLRTWAYAIARNASRMERRGAARRERRVPRVESSALNDVAQAVRTETLTFLRTDKRNRLEALREALSPEDRELLVLRVDRGLAWRDLARVLAEVRGLASPRVGAGRRGRSRWAGGGGRLGRGRPRGRGHVQGCASGGAREVAGLPGLRGGPDGSWGGPDGGRPSH